MFTDENFGQSQGPTSKTFLRKFAAEEDGVMTVLACFIILTMVLIGGIAVDLMHNEMERVRIQNVADRAVLAAADLDQQTEAEEIVKEYFRKSTPPVEFKSVTVEKGAGYKTVSIDASSYTNTGFMNVLGTDTLPIPSFAAAEERVNQVEISMVLDISGSMGKKASSGNSKIYELKKASRKFVDTVLKEENKDRVSVSLVPYSAHVNAGPDIMGQLNMKQSYHNFSHCVEFDDADFSSTQIDLTKSYKHMQHFQYGWGSSATDTSKTVCPRFAYERITALSQDANALKTQINSLRPRVQTSIFLGMKWATGLLDPAFKPVTSQLVSQGKVDSAFINRPAAHSDDKTIKTVVLMTDGINTVSRRLDERLYDTADKAKVWNQFNYLSYQQYFFNNYWRSNGHKIKYSGSKGNKLLKNICKAAKRKKIVVWTIGFEVSTESGKILQECASSPSHYFLVEGAELTETFEAIARQINQLRLTQ